MVGIRQSELQGISVIKMNIKHIEEKVPSSDGIHMLSGMVLIPDGEIRGLFHVVHGMTEYIGRYESFMRDMAQEGYIVFGFDNLGHGHTVNSPDEYGFIAHKDGWNLMVDDVYRFGKAMKEEYGKDLPYYLMGHSMGSFLVRLAAEKYDFQDKLIVMGTGGPQKKTSAGLAYLRAIKRIKGEKYVSKTINHLVFGAYNKRFGNDDPHYWLNTQESGRKAYAQDKLCAFSFTVSAMEDLVMLSRESNKKSWFCSGVSKKPILLLSGADDPVGDYGMGVKHVHDYLKAAGADVRFILYRGYRHEILNDSCRERVISEIKSFCSK